MHLRFISHTFLSYETNEILYKIFIALKKKNHYSSYISVETSISAKSLRAFHRKILKSCFG